MPFFLNLNLNLNLPQFTSKKEEIKIKIKIKIKKNYVILALLTSASHQPLLAGLKPPPRIFQSQRRTGLCW